MMVELEIAGVAVMAASVCEAHADILQDNAVDNVISSVRKLDGAAMSGKDPW